MWWKCFCNSIIFNNSSKSTIFHYENKIYKRYYFCPFCLASQFWFVTKRKGQFKTNGRFFIELIFWPNEVKNWKDQGMTLVETEITNKVNFSSLIQSLVVDNTCFSIPQSYKMCSVRVYLHYISPNMKALLQ